MTELRWNAPSGGDQKYLFYFHRPGDVRRMTCMVWKHAGAADERWMYARVGRDSVRYTIGLREEDFSQAHMKMELGEWLRR